MENFYNSPELLRHLRSKQIAATGTIRAKRMENALFQDLGKMTKEKGGTSDVATDFLQT